MELADALPAAVRMAQLLVRRREPCLVTRDASGGWRHRYWRAGTMVTPQARKSSWREAERVTHDVFCWAYTPRAGDIVAEAGAGCGTETVFLSRLVGPSGLVIACEAHPWTAELLRRTVAANGLGNVTVVQVALGAVDGSAAITDLPPGLSIGNTVVTGGPGLKVRALRLDTLIGRLGLVGVDLLKVNVEGAEADLLRGAPLDVVRHVVVSCHDFEADRTGNAQLRTRTVVGEQLATSGFEVGRRPEDPRPWIRDYLYGSRR